MSMPMLQDLRTLPLRPDIDPALARFSGVWNDSAWGDSSLVALAVERVGPDGAVGFAYALGAYAQFGFERRWSRRRGFTTDGRLKLDDSAGFTTDFTLGVDGVLIGRFVTPEGCQARVWLGHVLDRTSDTVSASLARPRGPPWEELRIPVRPAVDQTAAQTLQLQAIHYPRRLPGRKPLVMLNQGATDSELPGLPCVYPFEPEARFFLPRGCSGLALMRKGSGSSDALLLEEGGKGAAEMLVDSGVEDIHAAASPLCEQPHVDRSRVIDGGQSRGGLPSVAYAGCHPAHVEAAFDFAGGRWGEEFDRNGFLRRQAARAGSGATAPMLWLYGDRDSYYDLPFKRGMFEAFITAGRRGSLLTFRDLPGDGHQLMMRQDGWEGAAADVVLDGPDGEP